MMKNLFWILWSAEMLFLLWMLWDEMKLKHLSLPGYISFGFLWLAVALLIKLFFKSEKAALILVGIPAVPLAFMGVFLLVIFIVQLISGPVRWN